MFSWNIFLLFKKEWYKLKKARGAVPGMGGIGRAIVVCLARMDLENFHISDMDSFDVVNTDWQVGGIGIRCRD